MAHSPLGVPVDGSLDIVPYDNQALVSAGTSYAPASAVSAGSIQSLSYVSVLNQLVTSGDSGTAFSIERVVAGFPNDQMEAKTFFTDFNPTELSTDNTNELEVNASSDTEDVLYIINNHNDPASNDAVTVYKLVPNSAVANNWEITSFVIPTQDYTFFNPYAAVVINGTLYFGGDQRNLVVFDYDNDSYPNGTTASFTMDSDSGTFEGATFDGTHMYGLIRSGRGDIDSVEKWLWNEANPSASTLVQIYDLYDVPEFKSLRDISKASPNNLWKPHALEKDGSGNIYVGNNSNNNLPEGGGDPVPAKVYTVKEQTPSSSFAHVKFYSTLQEARNSNTSQPALQKGIQIADMYRSKNINSVVYSEEGALFNGTSRLDLYGANMVQGSSGFSIAVTVKPTGTPAANAGVIAIAYSGGGTNANNYLRVQSTGEWRFRWNGVSVDSTGGTHASAADVEQRLLMEFDEVEGKLWLSVIDHQQTLPHVLGEETASAHAGEPTRVSLGDNGTTGTPTPVDGGWVGHIANVVIYDEFMDLKSKDPSDPSVAYTEPALRPNLNADLFPTIEPQHGGPRRFGY